MKFSSHIMALSDNEWSVWNRLTKAQSTKPLPYILRHSDLVAPQLVKQEGGREVMAGYHQQGVHYHSQSRILSLRSK